MEKSELDILFKNGFDVNEWTKVLSQVFKANELRYEPEYVDELSQSTGANVWYLGEKTSETDYTVGYFVFEITSGTVVHKRVGLRNLTKSIVNSQYGVYDSVVAVFYDKEHWRCSFISDIRGDKTAPKRFTFVFGDKAQGYNTAVNRFFALQTTEAKYEDIKTAFSVDKLTEDFYDELFTWFLWATDKDKALAYFPNMTNTEKDDFEDLEKHIIRFLTRMIFVWFIKQKQLVSDNLFDEIFLSNILKGFDSQSDNSSQYYNAILQNLFFATLNCEINGRAFAETVGKRDSKNLYRYAELFTISKNEIKELFSKIPFLNGGLFECLDKDTKMDGVKLNIDGFSRNDTIRAGRFTNRAFIANKLFFDKDRGLFVIFSRYNFTVEENTPLEQTVALDPELLGKVFEELLGKYAANENISTRKKFGSFYTPRIIVNFMVDESLKHYLLVNGANKQTVENVFNDEFEGEGLDSIAELLPKVKILDPACGSGAFPMGILNRITDILLKINPKIDSYNQKLHIIENCIFGSDILQIAVQICKLRFFISLICDVEKDESKDNFGISPLPNLETKFVCADSLKSANFQQYNGDWTRDEKLVSLKNELLKIRECHFTAHSRAEKVSIREKDEEKRAEIAALLETLKTKPNLPLISMLEKSIVKAEAEINLLQNPKYEFRQQTSTGDLFGDGKEAKIVRIDVNEERRRKLRSDITIWNTQIQKEQSKTVFDGFYAAVQQVTKWNPYDQNAQAKFFDPDFMFNVSDGFDIIIGNPPYVSTKGVSLEDKKIYEQQFGFSDDLYNMFTFKGVSLLKDKGSQSFITPKTFWTTQTKRNMRDLLLSKNIVYIFDTGYAFDAMVDTSITQIENSPYQGNNRLLFLDGGADLNTPVKYEIDQKTYIDTQNSVIFKPNEYNLKIVKKYGCIVKKLYDKWWNKICTSRDIEKNKKELEEYRNNLKPGDIALLGCLTEGGQGLATANNGKYIAVRKATKWAQNIIQSRPKKLAEAIKKHKGILQDIGNQNPDECLLSKSESQIAELFDFLKEKYGRDIFGQGYIYKLIDDSEIADVNSLTEDEKQNGIDISKKYYVPYDKGDKDGNRWYLETPFAIAWSKENVHFLKTDPKARYQGYAFYFREGFCWTDINSTFLKARLKSKGVFDVVSMTLFTKTQLPDWYYVALINTNFMSLYVDNFINNTSHFQINDARQTPIIIPSDKQLNEFHIIFDKAYKIKQKLFSSSISKENADAMLSEMQEQLELAINALYAI